MAELSYCQFFLVIVSVLKTTTLGMYLEMYDAG